MSATPSKPKQTSRWGSLLSGAVANLESRLDNILADESTIASRNALVYQTQQCAAADRASRSNEPISTNVQVVQSRGSSISRTQTPQNDRPSRAATSNDERPSLGARSDSETRLPASTSTVPNAAETSTHDGHPGSFDPETENELTPLHSQLHSSSATAQLDSSPVNVPFTSSEDSTETANVAEQGQTETLAQSDASTLMHEQFQSRIAELYSENEEAEAHHQQELQQYLEKIDALESKLEYLAKKAAESARQAATEASPDSLEQKIAAKEEQIALLMEEGQKLSKAEVAQTGIAKKLKIKASEDGRTIAELRKKLVTLEKSATEMTEKTKKLETFQKDANFKLMRVARLEREVESLKASRDEKESTVQALRQRLDSESKRADEAAQHSNEAALEEHKKRVQSLEDDLVNTRIEKQLADDRAKNELISAKEELQREKQRSKSAEEGMRNEISVLENRLETLRSRTEEASSGPTNDVQAKLLRQIETLQSQYSLARENWQGIETSLQARITAVENERAEIARQEGEARKKAREATSSARHLQESLEENARKCQILEQDLSQRQAHAEKLENRLQEFEHSLKAANEKIEQERQAAEANLSSKIEEEKMKWRQEMASFSGTDSLDARTTSPIASLRKHPTLELPGLQTRLGLSRNTSTELSIPLSMEKVHSRRSSAKPGRSFDIGSPDAESGRSTPFLNGNVPPQTPSLDEVDADDLVETGSSPHRTVNDMISGSTAAAGPSVQLVERMSAKVRRLESEKAASKDEIARITSQREEARQEVVALMREVEEKRAVDTKIAKLEKDMAEVGERYHTTLEMLGEKSERVEELEADVTDLKKIYRELVESTVN